MKAFYEKTMPMFTGIVCEVAVGGGSNFPNTAELLPFVKTGYVLS